MAKNASLVLRKVYHLSCSLLSLSSHAAAARAPSVAGREVRKYWTERKQRWQVTFPITHPAQHLWGDLHDCDDCVSLGVCLCVTQWQRRTRDSERKGERRERLNCRAQKRMWAYVTARASAHVCEFVYACSPRAVQDKLGWVNSPGVIAVCVRMTRTFLLFFKPNPSFLSLHVSPSPFSPPLSVCALKNMNILNLPLDSNHGVDQWSSGAQL